MLVDAVQRLWRGFRNQNTQRLPFEEVAPGLAAVSGLAISSLLIDCPSYSIDDRAAPHAEPTLVTPLTAIRAPLEPEPLYDPGPAPLPPVSLAESGTLDGPQRRGKAARNRVDGAEAAAYDTVSLRHREDPVDTTACDEAHRNRGDSPAADLILPNSHSENGTSVEIAVNYALNAQANQDWEEALQRWHGARLTFPDLGAAWAAETAMLLILGRLDEAEHVAQQGAARLPDSIDILAQYAGVSIAREDWFGALDRIGAMEAQAPLHPLAVAHIAAMQDLVIAHIETLPMPELKDRTRSAERSGDWRTAARIWRIIHARDPANVRAIVGYGQALREEGAYDEADRVLSYGITLNSDDQELFANYAQVPAARHDWATATQRWQSILRMFPDTPALWSMAATAYREAGLFEPADLLLSRAIATEPDRIDLRVQSALVAERQENWPLAVERWDIAHRLWPDEPNIRNSRGDAIWQEASQRLERGDDPSLLAEQPPPTPAADMKHVALQFEGLGDNCEFGIVQRHFGADPIGLFRFAAISAETLTELLAEQFARLGDPNFTTLSLTTGNEFLVRDDRGFYHLHSFVRKGSVNEETFLRQQVVRLTYLKRKLLEDLRDCRKIFVHKSSISRINDETALRLYEAITQFGPNLLLVIRRAEAAYEPGAVIALRPGLLVGYVSTLYSGEGSPIDFDAWRAVLLAACEFRTSLARSSADPPKP